MRRLSTFLIMLILLSASACYASNADDKFRAENRGSIFHPDKSGDEELQALIAEYVPKFTLHTYSDDVSGLTLQYNIYLPDGYSTEKKYPAVFFIADGSSAGKLPEYSLTQGLGGLVWCRNNCVVIVPAYPSIVLDDHNGFVESEYVELTARFVDYAMKNYGVDGNRVYATGQSMGCMTWLVLASRYPEMFTAFMFVSGQWDISTLKGLKGQKFVYAASAGDQKASKGQQEVMDMFRADGVPYVSYMNIDAKKTGIIIPNGQPQSFVMFREKSTLPEDTKGNYSEHMTSFDYAYRIKALSEWLLAQTKEAK